MSPAAISIASEIGASTVQLNDMAQAKNTPASSSPGSVLSLRVANLDCEADAAKIDRGLSALSNVKEVKAREGQVIAIASEGDEEIKESVDHVIYVPEAPELLLPILEIIPLQLLAYHIAVRRGCDVDQPRNLAKSVTVE